jgi:asparagine synthase (glutamine-hydrolysing)
VCGFAGAASPRSLRVAARGEIEAMLAAIAHRGPDDEGIDVQPGFAVGFRRLAIMDVEHGRQPMSTSDGALQLVCNGEIYNHEELRQTLASRGHRLRTRSDSEVVLHAYREWGGACASLLRGIFAFAVWDASRRTLFLCRDRSGIKPCFLRVHGDEIFFASEAKALLAHPGAERRLDLLGCFASAEPDALLEASPFRGIAQLGAGCSLTFTAEGRVQPERYWTYAPTLDLGEDDGGGDDVAQFRDELARVVPMQLMADVPLGAYLSGGLDSSVVAALARAHAPDLTTFTSVCAGSEDPWFAYVLSRAAGLRGARFVRFAPEEILEEIPRVAWGAEGAFDLGFVARYQAAAAARRQGLKVLLSGQGADELMGGYARSYPAFEASARRTAYAARLLDDGWASIASALRDGVGVTAHDLVAHLEREHAALSHYLLRFEDRMGMLAGIEVRVPFLDHRLVEICAGIAGARRRRLFDDKHLLREAARGLIPEAVRLRTKLAFNAHLPPITQVLAAAAGDNAAAELLTDAAIHAKGYFEPRQVGRLRASGNYHALDAVLIVQLLDELFVTRFDPARFAGGLIPSREITVDASWMPAEAILLSARKGPSARDKPWLVPSVTHFGLLESALPGSPGGPRPPALLAIQKNDGRRALISLPGELDAVLVIELLRRADGTQTYAELSASIGAGEEIVLSIGRFAGAEGLVGHGPRALPS